MRKKETQQFKQHEIKQARQNPEFVIFNPRFWSREIINAIVVTDYFIILLDIRYVP